MSTITKEELRPFKMTAFNLFKAMKGRKDVVRFLIDNGFSDEDASAGYELLKASFEKYSYHKGRGGKFLGLGLILLFLSPIPGFILAFAFGAFSVQAAVLAIILGFFMIVIGIVNLSQAGNA